MSEFGLVYAHEGLDVSGVDTWAPSDKDSASDDLLVGVDLVDPHHFGLEQLDVLVGGGLLVDL